MVHKKLGAAVDTIGELFLVYAGMCIIAATAFSFIEGKTFIDSLYWAGVTAPGLGYGDVTPQTVAGKLLAIALATTSILIIVPLFTARLSMRLIVDNDTFTHEEQEEMRHKIDVIYEKVSKDG